MSSPIIGGFKKFILRGNAVDLAVGMMVGAAFTTVVNALVKDVLTPIIGAIAKTPDFSGLFVMINGSKILYGDFLNALISFLIVAVAIYFFVVTPMNTFLARIKKEEPVPPSTKKCPECLSEIPKESTRCAHCTTKFSA